MAENRALELEVQIYPNLPAYAFGALVRPNGQKTRNKFPFEPTRAPTEYMLEP